MPMPSTVTIRCNRNKISIKTKGHVSRTHETYCGSPVTDNQAPPLGSLFLGTTYKETTNSRRDVIFHNKQLSGNNFSWLSWLNHMDKITKYSS